MTEYERFIRAEAKRRGIDPDVAVTVARMEGGVDVATRTGDFDTGNSFWAYQLHYGGPGYEHFGTVAGMGNDFSRVTGWAPGDPAAWRDAARWALDRAKWGGWGPWYGAAKAGIVGMRGIDVNYPWTATPDDEWDYKKRGTQMPPPYTYNRNEPAHPQNRSFDCSQESLEWALYALGRKPQEGWLEPTMIAEGVMTPEVGLADASGAGLAAFVVRHYGSGPEPENSLKANNEPSISWEWAVHEGGNPDGAGHAYPVLIGGRAWNHWAGLRDFDPSTGMLLLANPADGWGGVGQTMTRAQFDALGPFSAVRVWHDDLLAPAPVEPPAPPIPPDTRMERIRALLKQAEAITYEPYP